MATNHTEHYKLSQWVKTDRVRMEDFNEDNLKIDAALDGKAEKAALEALTGRVGPLETVAASAVRLVTGSYTGTGASEPIHYTMGAKPKVLLLVSLNTASSGVYMRLVLATESFVLNVSRQGGTGIYPVTAVTFTEDGFTLDHANMSPSMGFNLQSVEYKYVALC